MPYMYVYVSMHGGYILVNVFTQISSYETPCRISYANYSAVIMSHFT